jgi:hypothetical protein
MRFLLLPFLLQPLLSGAVIYNLGSTRNFGGGNQTIVSGTLLPATNDQLPTSFSTGGPSPTDFSALSTVLGSPFRLGIVNSVSADATTDLRFFQNQAQLTDSVTVAFAGIQENGVTITGSSGIGYLIPTFRIQGSFTDTHPTAIAQVVMCVGIASCNPLTAAISSGGSGNVNTLYAPPINNSTRFTFGVPFQFFFTFSGSIQSNTQGSLAPGDISLDFTNGLQFLGYDVVDANGGSIVGAVVNSEFLNPQAAIPEPSTFALGAGGLLLGVALRRRRQLRSLGVAK